MSSAGTSQISAVVMSLPPGMSKTPSSAAARASRIYEDLAYIRVDLETLGMRV
jgi:hypothetical protein